MTHAQIQEMGRAMTTHGYALNEACRAHRPFTLVDYDLNTGAVLYHVEMQYA